MCFLFASLLAAVADVCVVFGAEATESPVVSMGEFDCALAFALGVTVPGTDAHDEMYVFNLFWRCLTPL